MIRKRGACGDGRQWVASIECHAFDTKNVCSFPPGVPGGVGQVLRCDPRNGGKMETWLDVPEGYGGRLFRATGMTWHEGDLLVASQGDGKVKRYDGRTGEWKADVALASPGGMTQIAVHGGRLFITDYVAQMLRACAGGTGWHDGRAMGAARRAGTLGLGFRCGRAGVLEHGGESHSPLRWPNECRVGRRWWWAGYSRRTDAGPDGNLYAASLHGQVTVWKTDAPNAGAPLQVIGGPEMKEPISIVFTTLPRGPEFVMAPPPAAGVESAEKVAFFESKIRPLLVERCIECHGEKKQKGGLRLDSRAAGRLEVTAAKPSCPASRMRACSSKRCAMPTRICRCRRRRRCRPAKSRCWWNGFQQGAVDPRSDALAAAQPASDDWAAEFQKRLDCGA